MTDLSNEEKLRKLPFFVGSALVDEFFLTFKNNIYQVMQRKTCELLLEKRESIEPITVLESHHQQRTNPKRWD